MAGLTYESEMLAAKITLSKVNSFFSFKKIFKEK